MTKRTGPIDYGEEIPVDASTRALLFRGLAGVLRGEKDRVYKDLIDPQLSRGYRIVPNWEGKTVRVFGRIDLADAAKAIHSRRRAAGKAKPTSETPPDVKTCPRFQPGMGNLERRGTVSINQITREAKE